MYSISIFARNEYEQQIFNYYNNKQLSQSTEFARQRKSDFWNTHTYFRHGVYGTFFYWAREPLVGQGCSSVQASRAHSDTLGLLWMSDKPKAGTSTWQHTAFTRDRHPFPGGIRTRNPSNWVAANPLLRPRGHWDRLCGTTDSYNSGEFGTACIKL